MASVGALAQIYKETKSKVELQAALEILVDESLEPDQVMEQRLNEVGFRFQIRSEGARERAMLVINAAIKLHDGEVISGGRGHFFDFSRRRIE